MFARSMKSIKLAGGGGTPIPTDYELYMPLETNVDDVSGNYSPVDEDLTFDGKSAYFCGGGSCYSGTTPAVNTGTGDFSVLISLKKNTFSTDWDALINNRSSMNTNSQQEWNIFLQEDNNRWEVELFNSSGSNYVVPLTGVPKNNHSRYYHVGFKVEGKLITAYVDGLPVSTRTFSGTRTSGAQVTAIGDAGWTYSYGTYKGRMSGVRVHKRALSDEEFAAVAAYEEDRLN